MVDYSKAEDLIQADVRFFGLAYEDENQVFVCRATGYGMVNAGINHGDLLFFKETDTFKDGDVVCLNVSEQMMVRRIFKEENGVRLRREIGRGVDVCVTDYTLLGKLIGLQRKM